MAGYVRKRMLLIPVTGTPSTVVVNAEGWHGMAEAIGAPGMIERVRVAEDYALAVDETGRIDGKPVNYVASVMYGVLRHQQPITGDVLFGREGWVGDGIDWQDEDPMLLYREAVGLLQSRYVEVNG